MVYPIQSFPKKSHGELCELRTEFPDSMIVQDLWSSGGVFENPNRGVSYILLVLQVWQWGWTWDIQYHLEWVQLQNMAIEWGNGWLTDGRNGFNIDLERMTWDAFGHLGNTPLSLSLVHHHFHHWNGHCGSSPAVRMPCFFLFSFSKAEEWELGFWILMMTTMMTLMTMMMMMIVMIVMVAVMFWGWWLVG